MPGTPILPISVRYEILNSPTAARPAALLNPKTSPATAVPVVSWSGSERIGRKLTGLHLDAANDAKLTVGRSWIRTVLNEQVTGVFRYLGGVEEHLVTGLNIVVDPCPDRTHQLDVPLLEPIDLAVGESLTDFLVELYGRAGFPENELDITASSITSGSLLAWAPGPAGLADQGAGPSGPTILEVALQIHRMLGYLPPHIDRNSRPQIRPVPTPEVLRPTFVYAPGAASRINNGSVRVSKAMSNSPNIYGGRSTSPSGDPVEGRYQIPADAPNSVENLGYPYPTTLDLPGVANDDQMREVLKAQARSDAQVVRTIEFTSTPNPDHDAWQVVAYKEERMLEHAWTLPHGPGEMGHVFKTAYANG